MSVFLMFRSTGFGSTLRERTIANRPPLTQKIRCNDDQAAETFAHALAEAFGGKAEHHEYAIQPGDER